MVRSGRRRSGEDAFYASLFAYLRHNGVAIACLVPLLVVLLLPKDVSEKWWGLLLIMYLGEAIAYVGLQLWRGVRPAEIAASLRSAGLRDWTLILVAAVLVAKNISEGVGS
jgi:hypothetical protein